jgi:sugar (pentulose or hexulose) kinase
MSTKGGSVLVVDVGTSGVRAALVRPDATVDHVHYARSSPTPRHRGWWSSTPD